MGRENSAYKKLVEAQRIASRIYQKDSPHQDTPLQDLEFKEAVIASPVAGPSTHGTPTPNISRISTKGGETSRKPGAVYPDQEATTDIETGKPPRARKQSMLAVFNRILRINAPEYPLMALGLLGAAVSGSVNPVFAIVFSNILQVFSKTGTELENGKNFWALIFVIIAG